MSATLQIPRTGRAALLAMAPFLFIIGVAIGSSVMVSADMTGVVVKHFGRPLPAGHIVARSGEQGPQAQTLGPGWHFGYIPLLCDVKQVPVAIIEHGKLGFVTAKDGEALPEGETFAKTWASASDMLNPTTGSNPTLRRRTLHVTGSSSATSTWTPRRQAAN